MVLYKLCAQRAHSTQNAPHDTITVLLCSAYGIYCSASGIHSGESRINSSGSMKYSNHMIAKKNCTRPRKLVQKLLQ